MLSEALTKVGHSKIIYTVLQVYRIGTKKELHLLTLISVYRFLHLKHFDYVITE